MKTLRQSAMQRQPENTSLSGLFRTEDEKRVPGQASADRANSRCYDSESSSKRRPEKGEIWSGSIWKLLTRFRWAKPVAR
ncbi:hypothetical protein D3C87_1284440 [compost metagenome]